jgi:hypothetical protein
MKRHPESHLDHGLTEAQIAYIFERFATRDSFFIETIELPPELGSVPCGLYGPIMGDEPIAESEVSYGVRGSRAWKSRIVQRLGVRTTRLVTVIAGPHEEPCPMIPIFSGPIPGLQSGHEGCPMCDHNGKIKHACILFTAFGGPLTPQEPGDPSCKDLEASTKFWSEHALVH